ncbi:MAG TPA: helix-turn-helix domain-containing protein [Pseudolysinimonas sp.]|nr:helix-turn-helix domain-containing protein [Pseudolysinimonas sp.]
MEGGVRPDQAAAVAALRDPTRRALFDVVARSRAAVSIDDVVRATGTPKSTAALHLDRLVALGVLAVAFERRTGRTGPGAGRPAKVYRAVGAEVAASIPARDYELMGDVLAGALETAEATGSVADAVRRAAAAQGEALLRRHGGDPQAALTAVGYEPVTDNGGVVSLTNCPFHRLAAAHSDLVCRANLALVDALVTDENRHAVLAPAPGRCCVQLVPSANG